MEVMYTINPGYLDIMLASLLSMYENGNLDEINLNVVTEGFSSQDLYKLESFVSQLDRVNLKHFPLENFNIDRFNLPNWRNSQIANARLFFEELLSGDLSDIHHLLYLDADTIVKGRLDELHKYDDEVLSLAPDSGLKSYQEKLGLNHYYNTGVIYVNVDKWQELGMQSKLVKEASPSKCISFPDQDLFNIIFCEYINPLPQKYNVCPNIFMYGPIGTKLYTVPRNVDYKDTMEAKDDPRILHTCGFADIKAWDNQDINPFTNDFMYYLDQVNPDFERRDLSPLKKAVALNKTMFGAVLLARSFVPARFEDKVRSKILTMTGRIEKDS